MIPLPLQEVRRLCPGRLEGAAEQITGVEIDSRRVSRGDLFVAVGRGAEYLDEARERGAAATLVPEDAFEALAALGTAVRTRSTARVVGITGSTGKTSTKDILASLCRPHARVVAAEGGHNNEIGLPLTLTRIEPDTDVVIAEMGMRGLGQISALCAVARPDVGVVTGVGPVHLELLGTVDRVAEAKAEVVASLPAGGTAVVPADAPALDRHLRRDDVDVIRFGRGGEVELGRFDPPLLEARVRGRRVALQVPFTARHQAENTLAALGAYQALGLPLDRAGAGAPDIAFSRWRGEEADLADGVLLINDAYNANPVSMGAALEHLRARAAGRRTVAVLGEMAELGPEAPRYHREIEPERHADVVVAVGGELAREYGGTLVGTVDEAVALLGQILLPGDVVLVKGSRAAGLEAVAEALTRVPA